MAKGRQLVEAWKEFTNPGENELNKMTHKCRGWPGGFLVFNILHSRSKGNGISCALDWTKICRIEAQVTPHEQSIRQPVKSLFIIFILFWDGP